MTRERRKAQTVVVESGVVGTDGRRFSREAVLDIAERNGWRILELPNGEVKAIMDVELDADTMSIED